MEKTSFLLKNIRIKDKDQFVQKSLFIHNGIIREITDYPEKILTNENCEIIDASNLFASPGWFDMRALIPEPGFEFKEDIQSACLAAAHGGFTGVAVMPNTQPVIQTKESVQFFRNKKHLVSLYPIAALTQQTDGQDMTEILDLIQAGAVAFSDGIKPVYHSGVLSRTIQYLGQTQALLMNIPDEKNIGANGLVHEGAWSTWCGLKGHPAVAELMGIQQGLSLLEYTGGKMHFSCISSARGVELIRNAKARGMQVTCDVASYHLAFTDADIVTFDTNLKVFPPLRSESDQKALWEGLADGTIDVIVSNHIPQDEEHKKLEFDLSSFGMINLQTSFTAANTNRPSHFSLTQLIEKITDAPRKLLNLEPVSIKLDTPANITVFDPEKSYEFTTTDIKSKSLNSPFVGKYLKGKAVMVFNNLEVMAV